MNIVYRDAIEQRLAWRQKHWKVRVGKYNPDYCIPVRRTTRELGLRSFSSRDKITSE